MIDISFKINGRSVTAKSFQDEFERAIFESIKDSLTSSVRSVRCSTHNQRPKLKVTGRDLNSLNVNVEGCCDELVQAAAAKLQ